MESNEKQEKKIIFEAKEVAVGQEEKNISEVDINPTIIIQIFNKIIRIIILIHLKII